MNETITKIIKECENLPKFKVVVKENENDEPLENLPLLNVNIAELEALNIICGKNNLSIFVKSEE